MGSQKKALPLLHAAGQPSAIVVEKFLGLFTSTRIWKIAGGKDILLNEISILGD